MLSKVSISLALLFLAFTQVFAASIGNLDASLVRDANNLPRVPATRLGIVGAFSLDPFPPAPGILRAPGFRSALNTVASPVLVPSSAGLASTVGLGALLPPSIRVGSTFLAPRRPFGVPGPVASNAALVEPSLAADAVLSPVNAAGVAQPSIFPVPVQRPLTPILTVPGIVRAGRSLPETDEKDNAVTSQIETPSHHRVKRQYFKPSIDGSMLSNDRSQLLKASNDPKASNTTAPADTNQKKPKITVPSLIHSLMQLFDRIKTVLKKALEDHESE